ncbi:probable disease resistance protein At4g27220 [Neltuma alba]|uniref:probable disease resistance protein At4g27220 n=1 Tax=Neltuma alba TaxID=207710 RepID=UPI0010A31750|nr:probable disease resistance protein At4g27220 [Prosopis alba]
MSPKTMWEGMKAPQQVQIDSEAMHQERIKVGPFCVPNNVVDEPDLQLIQYVFERLSDRCEIFSSHRSFLYQSQLTTLRPGAHLDSSVIDFFADILTDNERRNKSKVSNWYLPVMFSKALDSGDVSFFLDFVQRNNMRDNYMSESVDCEKIFIPVHVEKNSCGHYYLYIIHTKNQEVEIWDSLCDRFMDETKRDQTTENLLLAMDNLFENVMFTKFDRRMASNILLQPNGHDCGIFVINYMQQSDHYVTQNPLFQFDSDKERLDLALKLLKSNLNNEQERLYDEAARSYAKAHSEEDLDLRGTKRKWVEDVGRGGAYMELDDSDNTVKRKNVRLKTECSRGYLLPPIDLLGEEFQRYTQQIWKWITEDEVSAIGIWGMGGAGKTALATHVHNKLLEEAGDDFEQIIWVTVSHYDDSICKLQKAIARSINLDISDECDVKRISGKLLHAFKHITRCVVILDDVWNPIYLEEVGFPVSNNGIKLILTTRLWEVCQSMNCMKNIIEVEPLGKEDGFDLFKKTLGVHQIQPIGVEPKARAVAKQCERLPLAIVMIARSMKGKEHIREWDHLLECLQNKGDEQYHMDERVFQVLKSSYSFLNDKLQRFFLYCAFSVSKTVWDSDIEPLVRRFCYGEWTDGTKSFTMRYNEGYAMWQKLKNSSLLLKKNGTWRVHTLLQVMALTIAKKTEKIMTKHGMNLIGLSENGKWNENLQNVFLSRSNVPQIFNDTSPKCSKLSALLLDSNFYLKWIPDDFFINMPALKILDLSRTSIGHLPKSVSNLECLIALLLSRCGELKYVPSLAKLRRLIELDLSCTAISEEPCGLELLVNLELLNLEGTGGFTISSSTISELTNLQSLLMRCHSTSMDLRGLRKLKVISVTFCDIEKFNDFVISFLDEDRGLKGYYLSLVIPPCDDDDSLDEEACHLKRVFLCGIDWANRVAVLPGDVKELIISECDHLTRTTCLCCALSVQKNNNNLPKIEWFEIRACDELEYLFCGTPTCSFCASVMLVERLYLDELKNLTQIVMPLPLSLNSLFLYLRELHIQECSGMTILMTSELLAQLQNLETISVADCESMEEIIRENGEGPCSVLLSNVLRPDTVRN